MVPTAFDIAVFNASGPPAVYIIAVFDSNYGLRYINFDPTSLTFQLIFQISIEQIYFGLGVLPVIDVIEIHFHSLVCKQNQEESCTAQVFLLAQNFHSCMTPIVMSNSGFDIKIP